MDQIKILIADDHAVVREGTRQILEHEPDLTVVAEASDGEEAVKLAGSAKPDVAIIDISMPRVDGIEATKRIKALYPSIAVLILSAYDDEQFIFGLLEAGAAGYLLKSVRGRELIDAVRQVYAGESVLHPAIARKVLNRFVPGPEKLAKQKLAEVLSKREMDVLKLAAKGLSNQDIANELIVSVKTVEWHRANLMSKLGAHSAVELTRYAIRHRLVDADA